MTYIFTLLCKFGLFVILMLALVGTICLMAPFIIAHILHRHK